MCVCVCVCVCMEQHYPAVLVSIPQGIVFLLNLVLHELISKIKTVQSMEGRGVHHILTPITTGSKDSNNHSHVIDLQDLAIPRP